MCSESKNIVESEGKSGPAVFMDICRSINGGTVYFDRNTCGCKSKPLRKCIVEYELVCFISREIVSEFCPEKERYFVAYVVVSLILPVSKVFFDGIVDILDFLFNRRNG